MAILLYFPEGATLLASTDITPHQAFSYGHAGLALQFHAEASGARMEPWLIGHTLELRKAGIDINQLRQAGLTDLAKKTVAGQNMLEQWLVQVGLV
jgi:GMP synthase (glutamine-hydrolysing)